MTDSADRVLHEQWFRMMANASLPDAAARALAIDGFVVIAGPVPADGLPALSDAYDRAVLVHPLGRPARAQPDGADAVGHARPHQPSREISLAL